MNGLEIAPTPNMACMSAIEGPALSRISHIIIVLQPTSDVETAAPNTKNAAHSAVSVGPSEMLAKHNEATSPAVPTRRLPHPRSYPRTNNRVPAR
jgi:hypothetical protein